MPLCLRDCEMPGGNGAHRSANAIQVPWMISSFIWINGDFPHDTLILNEGLGCSFALLHTLGIVGSVDRAADGCIAANFRKRSVQIIMLRSIYSLAIAFAAVVSMNAQEGASPLALQFGAGF